jgi:hypothetical protein
MADRSHPTKGVMEVTEKPAAAATCSHSARVRSLPVVTDCKGWVGGWVGGWLGGWVGVNTL